MAYNSGEKIWAGELSALLAEIKTEFQRRNNTYNTTSLYDLGINLSLPTSDGRGTSIAAVQGDVSIGSLLRVKTNNPNFSITKGAPIEALSKYFTIVNEMKGYEATVEHSAGCGGACQGLCYGTCYTGCTGCTGKDSSNATTSPGGTTSGCGSCNGGCTSGCASSCSGKCQGTCSSCSGGCHGCVGSCNSSCSITCGSNCAVECSSGCEGCSGTCQSVTSQCNGCGKSCANQCKGNCSGTCYNSCGTGCYTGCSSNCYANCSATCNIGCTGNCFNSCSSGCGANCTGTVGTGPYTPPEEEKDDQIGKVPEEGGEIEEDVTESFKSYISATPSLIMPWRRNSPYAAGTAYNTVQRGYIGQYDATQWGMLYKLILPDDVKTLTHVLYRAYWYPQQTSLGWNFSSYPVYGYVSTDHDENNAYQQITPALKETYKNGVVFYDNTTVSGYNIAINITGLNLEVKIDENGKKFCYLCLYPGFTDNSGRYLAHVNENNAQNHIAAVSYIAT